MEELLVLQGQVEVQMAAIDTCQYSSPIFQQILTTIQKAVDALSLHQFSNLTIWVQRLDEEVLPSLSDAYKFDLQCNAFQIERKLSRRLQEGIKAWTRVLQGRSDEDLDTTWTQDQLKQKAGGDPSIQARFACLLVVLKHARQAAFQKMIHEMRLTQQVMYLCPSVEEARQNLLQQLFSWEAIITTQQRISSTRFQV